MSWTVICQAKMIFESAQKSMWLVSLMDLIDVTETRDLEVT